MWIFLASAVVFCLQLAPVAHGFEGDAADLTDHMSIEGNIEIANQYLRESQAFFENQSIEGFSEQIRTQIRSLHDGGIHLPLIVEVARRASVVSPQTGLEITLKHFREHLPDILESYRSTQSNSWCHEFNATAKHLQRLTSSGVLDVFLALQEGGYLYDIASENLRRKVGAELERRFVLVPASSEILVNTLESEKFDGLIAIGIKTFCNENAVGYRHYATRELVRRGGAPTELIKKTTLGSEGDQLLTGAREVWIGICGVMDRCWNYLK